MTIKEQLTEARDLIRQKKYDSARKILYNTDHELARKWLKQIDQIAPPPKPKRTHWWLVVPFVIALLATAVVIILASKRSTQTLALLPTVIPQAATVPSLLSSGFLPISVSNLTPGYALKGKCGNFSPDSKLVVVSHQGVYDVASGKQRFPFQGINPHFSPDGTLVAVYNDGVYEVATGKRRFSLSLPDSRDLQSSLRISDNIRYTKDFLLFSSDNQLLAVFEDGVYETASGRKLYSITRDATFSPDSRLIDTNGGIRDARTGAMIAELEGGAQFSPDGSVVAIRGKGVYDTVNFIQLFPLRPVVWRDIGGMDPYSPKSIADNGFTDFSPDSKLLAVSGEGVFEIATREKLFNLRQAGFVHFSPDGKLVSNETFVYDIVSRTYLRGVFYPRAFSPDSNLIFAGDSKFYDLTTHQESERLYNEIVQFSPDGTLLAVNMQGPVCFLYGAEDSKWPFRSGLITVKEGPVFVRPEPNKDEWDSYFQPPFITANDRLTVLSQTPDHQWYRIILENLGLTDRTPDSGWIMANETDSIFMPADLPIENPESGS